jgi:molybdopterin/thiamine biosynthesis adenylyltransferase
MKKQDGLTHEVVETLDLPTDAGVEHVYRLLPQNRGEGFYAERTGRNLGWITAEEQEILRNSVVAVAGCGGMGGVGAELLVRAGVGEVRIADLELFDASNIHRQIAAGVDTIGASKAFATARRLRGISDDTALVVYPQGVTLETVSHFVKGADLVLDEVEAWAVFARILLHQEARRQGVDTVNCCSLGTGTRLFLFTSESDTMEQCLGVSYEASTDFQQRLQAGTATLKEKRRMGEAVIRGLLPELPEYMVPGSGMSTVANLKRRLLEEGKAMILATNPYGAASFMTTHSIFHLLRNSGVARAIVRPVPMPGYLYRDDLLGMFRVVRERWY